ncbi:MAG: aspartyl-trna synthetase [Rhodobacteraceae bacterium]|nr:aspartyl-trna synthetase [Paracoccaceae bacterium]
MADRPAGSVARFLAQACAVFVWLAATVPEPASAQADAEQSESGGGGPSGLPLPRFASLRTEPVNLRTGPGVRYPIDWVYQRRTMPVEIVAEFDTWRRVRDPDGDEGWVHQSMLSGRRTAVVRGDAHAIRRAADEISPLVATVEPGVIVSVQRCPNAAEYCRVEIDDYQGWIRRDVLWGLLPGEAID